MPLNCGNWRRLLRVPWTAGRSNQSILKEINPEYSLEGLVLKLKLEYFGHLMQSTESLEKTLMLGKIESRKRRGWQRMRCWMVSPTRWTWVWASSGSWWWTGKPGVFQSMGSQRVGHNWVTELNWTDCLWTALTKNAALSLRCEPYRIFTLSCGCLSWENDFYDIGKQKN